MDLESLLVGTVVVVCAIFSVWRLMSVRLRLKTLDVLSVLPASLGGRLATRLRGKMLGKLSGGCGSCQANPTLNATAGPWNRRPGAPRR